MGSRIHPTAVVGDDVEIGDGCEIGPYVVIESGARIGNDNEIAGGGYVFGSVRMGNRNRLMRATSLGGEPQSKAYKGEPTLLEIGDDNWFGENTVVHRGTVLNGKTTVGNHLYLMNGGHIGHDSVVGDHVTMAPDAKLGGVVTLMDHANLGAAAGVHQNTRVGELVMVGAMARVTQDVLPFTTIAEGGRLYGLNSFGIKKAGHSPKELTTLRAMYRKFCVKREPLPSFLKWLDEQPSDRFLEAWKAFLAVPTDRGYARGRSSRRMDKSG